MFKKPKISLIGAGNIGGTLALLLLQKQLGDVVLFDVVEGMPQGKALDILQSMPELGIDATITGTNNYEDISGSDIVVVTAGVPRKPGMSRDDLLAINTKVMKGVGENIKKYCHDAFVICVTNPLDVMVSVLEKYSNVPSNKIVGMAGVLDSSRFRTFLSEATKVSVKEVQAYVLGGHGDTMVPLTKFSNIAGVSLEDCVTKGMLTQKQLDDIVVRTKNGGGEIVNLLKNGSAYFAPAVSILSMVQAVVLNENRILPCASKITKKQYGINQPIFVGVPTKLGKNGVVDIIEVELTEDERKQFNHSIQAVITLNQDVEKFL